MAKKKIGELSMEARKDILDRDDSDLSLAKKCRLLGVPRSSFYYAPVPTSPEDIEIMNWIDEQYTATPFYGSRKMAAALSRAGYSVNRKRVVRLMNKMGLEAVYPGPKTSKPHPDHKIYPYLLRGVTVGRVNHVWSTDITYIRLARGFAYLVAVMDWFSRYVLSWRLSNCLETGFCLEALEAAFATGHSPEIWNVDQGSQFTSKEYVNAVTGRGVRISMDGKGRALDNVFVERLWRSVKYEDVYINGYATIGEARVGLGRYFNGYNNSRVHQALGNKYPTEIFHGVFQGSPLTVGRL